MEWPKWARWTVLALVTAALVITAACCPPGNNPPVITSLTADPTSVAPGEASIITCDASDPDGDTLTYSWAYSGPSTGSIPGTGSTITWVAPDAEGTYTISVTVDDGRGGTATENCQVTVATTVGSINITSDPMGARVYIDGVDTGDVTPFNTNLAAGDYIIKLTYEHYKDLVEMVTVSPGPTTYIHWVLTYAPPQTVTIKPGPAEGKDSYVSENNPAVNYGSDDSLFAGAAAADERYRSYLQFDLSTIPSTAVVTDADLGLYYYDTSVAIAMLIEVYNVTSSWDENAITWFDQRPWAEIPEATVTMPADATYDFIYWAIDELVQGWIDGSITNNGVSLKDDDESTVEARKGFYSSEYTAYSGRCPKLVITYYDPAAP